MAREGPPMLLVQLSICITILTAMYFDIEANSSSKGTGLIASYIKNVLTLLLIG